MKPYYEDLRVRIVKAIKEGMLKDLIEALGRALNVITSRDAEGFFGHCGYRLPGLPL
jgi:hypothetical protein